ncbi:MAG: Ppx/GppA phosphatase family protein [Pseudomonadota bacterium]
MAPTKRAGRVLAAVDLGSNSFHMIVARYDAGRLQTLDRLREMVRLAAGLDDQHYLSDERQAVALACLERFGERLAEFRPRDVRAVDTNTLRKAKNSGAFLKAARRALGHPIDIVSGREEARLIYLGAVHGAPPSDGRRLVLDIGGGSTELIVGERDEPKTLYSLFMGCVSVSKRFFPDGHITRDGVRAARVAIDLELSPVLAPLRSMGWDQELGCSGTIRTVEKLSREFDPASDGITLAAINDMVRRISVYGNTSDIPFAAINERRRPVFLGGLLILERLFEGLKLGRLRVADGALREGAIFDMLGARAGRDAHDTSVAAFQERYLIDREQAGRVESVLETMFDDIGDDWSVGSRKTRRLLRYAARLHEVGLSIAHSHYHRHGAYIVQNADLPGFSQHEQTILAWLIGGHRRRVPREVPLALRRKWRERLPRMLALLRMATVLTRARQDSTVPSFRMSVEDDVLTLAFPVGWLEVHPLTAADVEREVLQLKEIGIELVVAEAAA